MFDRYSIEAEQIKRRRAVADAMMAQAMNPLPSDRSVSGRVIPLSPWEGLAQVARSLSGTLQARKADEQMSGLGERRRKDIADAVDEYTRSTQGRQISVPDVGAMTGSFDEQDAPRKDETVMPSVTDRRAAAMTLAGRIGDPSDTAKLLVADAMKAPAAPKITTAAPGSRVLSTDDQGRTSVLMDVPDKPKAGSSLSQLMAERDALPPNDPRRGLYDQAIRKATTHQPAATVNVNTEKKYGEQFGGLIAKSDVDMLESARKAPALAERANRIKETLASGRVITGAGADIRLSLGKALNLVGASDAETIANTEAVATSLAQNTLDAIKASGLGSGTGFSNADRDFLEKAVGGKISLEAGTIDRLADLAHRAAEKSAESWSTRVKDIPDSALSGTGIKRDPLTVPPLFQRRPRGTQPTNRRSTDAPLPKEVEDALKKYGGGNG